MDMIYDGCDQSPSKEQLLREEYPDLEEKWKVYRVRGRDFLEAHKELKKFGIIKRFFNAEEYHCVRDNWVKAKLLYMDSLEEYHILEKLLWVY